MEARSTKQVHGSKKQKPSSETITVIWLSKKNSLGPAQIHAGPKRYPHRVQKTHKQVPNIFCDPRSKLKSGQVQKTRTGPKKKVPRSKNHASLYIYIYNITKKKYWTVGDICPLIIIDFHISFWPFYTFLGVEWGDPQFSLWDLPRYSSALPPVPQQGARGQPPQLVMAWLWEFPVTYAR